jgi:hypothetical protein
VKPPIEIGQPLAPGNAHRIGFVAVAVVGLGNCTQFLDLFGHLLLGCIRDHTGAIQRKRKADRLGFSAREPRDRLGLSHRAVAFAAGTGELRPHLVAVARRVDRGREHVVIA